MDSKKLNNEIQKLCDSKQQYEAFGGKSIPYIGWFWRDVNFDANDYAFGMFPGGTLGFMENNKWEYENKHCSPVDWEKIKLLLIEAVRKPSLKTLKAVNDKIQSL